MQPVQASVDHFIRLGIQLTPDTPCLTHRPGDHIPGGHSGLDNHTACPLTPS
jgi:hypothetical protein